MKKLISILMCSVIVGGTLLNLSACGSQGDTPETESNMNINESGSTYSEATADTPYSKQQKTEQTVTKDEETQIRGAVDVLSSELLKRNFSTNENTLFSPVSIYTILSLLSNGADNNTKAQINDVLNGFYQYGDAIVCYDYGPISTDSLNQYVYNYMEGLEGVSNAINDPPLELANSIWLRDDGRLKVEQDFINIGESFYNAGVFNEPFDSSTLDKMNSWTNEKTKGRISNIVDDIPYDAVVYLINALAFDGVWEDSYTKNDVSEGIFNNADGTESKVDYMTSNESYYISDGYAEGFIKDYKGEKYIEYENSYDDGGQVKCAESRYCFAALLPNEDIGLEEYIERYFTAGTITDCIENAENVSVHASMPKFSYDTSMLLNETFDSFGMTDMFDSSKADFSKLGTSYAGNLYVSRVIHKTYITVDENGTKAAATTAVEIFDEACIEESFAATVVLDRPFVYVIYDKQEKIPVFIGTVVDF